MKYFLIPSIIFVILSVAGCGLKGELSPPQGADPAYPRTYPIGN